MAYMDDAPATKRDIDELRQEMNLKFEEQENRLTEVMRNIETSLLKAFYGYGETTRQRFAMIEGQTDNVIQRMRILEDRVFEIEKRLNLPPAA